MAKIKYLAVCALLFMLAGGSYAQQASDDFEFLVAKIKSDYPGYPDKVKPDLFIMERQLRSRVKSYPDSSFFYLNRYISYFNDGHLRIERTMPESHAPKKTNTSSYGEPFLIDTLLEKQTYHQLEGVWTSMKGDITITGCPKKKDVLLGVSINFNDWKPGSVVYEFIPLNDSILGITEHTMYEGQQPIRKQGSLELNKQIIEIHDWNVCFTRKSDSPTYDNAVLSTYRPKRPNGRNIYPQAVILDDSTFYMRITSFADNKDYITNLVAENWTNITHRSSLIIDIRSNYGGQSDSYAALEPLMYTNEFGSKGVEYYATPGNIAHFEHSIARQENRNGNDGLKWIQSLVDEMKKNIGGYVVHPYDQREEMISMDTVYENPKRIGIIIENSNASAAEQFLLYAKNSRKVILFGNESTAGILDYSNATPTNFPSNRYELYCPMSRSVRLPETPIDNIGIKPDIYIPFPATKDLYDRLDEWVYFVMNYLHEISDSVNHQIVSTTVN